MKLESLGDSISSAVVVEWKKNPGDKVNLDDVIAVVETDKVFFLESPSQHLRSRWTFAPKNLEYL